MSGELAGAAASGWVPPALDAEAFATEQNALGQVWTLLGWTRDVAREGDWFTAHLGGRSVFVQRFREGLRAFENKCAHRFFPLRQGETGNGPVICGFHHWRYNSDGMAIGIPKSEEMFGATPRDMGICLRPVEIEICGSLIFGRFASAGHPESLRAFLGPLFDIVRAMSPDGIAPLRGASVLPFNWRFAYEIALDDYHIVAVHSDTFGKRGYMLRDRVQYERSGPHSAYCAVRVPDLLEGMASACNAGTYRPSNDYLIMHLFPNIALVQTHVATVMGVRYVYLMLLQFVPLAPDNTLLRWWLWPSPFPTGDTPLQRVFRRISMPISLPLTRRGMLRILAEDNAVCAHLQAHARPDHGPPRLGAMEERIGWHNEAYRQVLEQARRDAARE